MYEIYCLIDHHDKVHHSIIFNLVKEIIRIRINFSSGIMRLLITSFEDKNSFNLFIFLHNDLLRRLIQYIDF